MRQIDCKKVFKDYSRIILGTFIAGCGIAVFSNPAKLTGGGTTGVGTIIYYTFGIDPGVTMLCINIPLFFLGMHFFGSMYGEGFRGSGHAFRMDFRDRKPDWLPRCAGLY